MLNDGSLKNTQVRGWFVEFFSNRKVVNTGEIPSQKAKDQTTEAAVGYKIPLRHHPSTDCRDSPDVQGKTLETIQFRLKGGCQFCSCQLNSFDFLKHDVLDPQSMHRL